MSTKPDFDPAAIVPSTRDLFQVIGTRRRSLALVGLVGESQADITAARLHDQNVSALAFAAPGPAMQLGARATKTVPALSLLAIENREDAMRSRFFGADGVCVDAKLGIDEWDALAKTARTMRMVALALVRDAEGMQAAVAAGARAVLLRAPSAGEVVAIAGGALKTMVIVADVAGIDAAGLRALKGQVDAAVAPPSVHSDASFPSLVAEVDP